ncbi:MAG: hypothetical protein JXR64_03030 [Spirochaetales bacterium]|nr:hypothetical protein [Spirochaetales bacterium]
MEKKEAKVKQEEVKKNEQLTNYQTKQLLIEADKLKSLNGFAFVMAIADVKRRIQREQKVLNEIIEPSEKFKEYQKELSEINRDYSKKDENGDPIIITEIRYNQEISRYDFDEELKEEREKKKTALNKKYKSEIEEQKEKEKQYNEAMNEYSTLRKKELSEKQLPKNITLEQLEIAYYFLDIKP